MSSTETDWNAVSFVTSSKYRTQAMEALSDQPQTPTEIDGDRTAHISRALTSLRDEGLVDLLVDEERQKGRFYGLTERGEEIARAVDQR